MLAHFLAKKVAKAEFGLFKKDTAVVAYREKEKPREEVRMQFGKQTEEIVEEKPKKDTKIGKTFQKWKEEAKKENEGTVEFK